MTIAPSLLGSAVPFNSVPTTVQVTKEVTANSIVGLWFAAGNNAPYNLTITDNMGGTNSSWISAGSNGADPTKCGWRYRRVPRTGTLVVTVGKDGAATFTGLMVEIQHVATASVFDGAAVNNYADSGTRTVTPSNTAVATDLLLAAWAGTNAAYATGFSYSDTFAASNNTTGGKQVHLQSRTTTTTGVQSDFTFTFGGGSSGTDLRSMVTVINLQGTAEGPAATLSTPGSTGVTDTTVTATITSNTAGGVLHSVACSTNSAPTAAQIKAGSGGTIVARGGTIAASGSNSISIVGLSQQTTYYLFFLQDNGADSNIPASVSFTTAATVPVITSVSDLTPQEGDTLLINSAGGATGFGSTQGTVTIGGASATITAWAAGQIAATVPIGANAFGVAVNVTVTNADTGLTSDPYALTSISPPTGYNDVNLTSVNATPNAQLLEALPALAIGNQIEWGNVAGTGTVTVNPDMTVTWSPTVTSFDARAWTSPDGWGNWATIQTNPAAAPGVSLSQKISGVLTPITLAQRQSGSLVAVTVSAKIGGVLV